MIERLVQDHDNARRLAEGIAKIGGLSIEPERVQTNIVYFDLASEKTTAEQLAAELADKGVRMLQLGPARLRAVTHCGIAAEDIDTALSALKEVMQT